MRCIMLQVSAPVLGLSRLGRGQLTGDEFHYRLVDIRLGNFNCRLHLCQHKLCVLKLSE